MEGKQAARRDSVRRVKAGRERGLEGFKGYGLVMHSAESNSKQRVKEEA